ncbi:MAG: type 1 glutamine amidotransferase [Verrucomicrobiae bacterium]|nr:type 1 glutamine amidotransferase [Verrucomicrobiae bacterium]
MHAHVLQHAPFEGIGSCADWLKARGAVVTTTRFYESADLPSLEGIDLVIAMGGPMSVNDEASLPWLVAEKAFLRAAIDRGIAVLGICLGAQLIASACGARVFRGRHREIGWFPIEALASGVSSIPVPENALVLHWHGETFDLPKGAVHLARSTACEHQAFQIGERVLGLQFHPEVTPGSLATMLEYSRDDLVPGEFVQSEAEILSTDPGDFTRLAELTAALLDHLTADR